MVPATMEKKEEEAVALCQRATAWGQRVKVSKIRAARPGDDGECFHSSVSASAGELMKPVWVTVDTSEMARSQRARRALKVRNRYSGLQLLA